MNQPCRISDAGADSDADLQADTQTAECVRELRTNILSLAIVVSRD
ncbi:hypothetical protein [Klebsiella pneumoniae IS53]|nr:hypothetical protein [Klebsiella pneumoniae IS53]